MGVTLERVQNKFACIIGELCSEPVILSKFAIWLDLRLAEYKAKGAISLDCSGENPDPGWLKGHEKSLCVREEKQQLFEDQYPYDHPSNRSAGNVHLSSSGSMSQADDRTFDVDNSLAEDSLEPDVVVVKEESDVETPDLFPVSLHRVEASLSRKRHGLPESSSTSSYHTFSQSPAKAGRFSDNLPSRSEDELANQSLISIINKTKDDDTVTNLRLPSTNVNPDLPSGQGHVPSQSMGDNSVSFSPQHLSTSSTPQHLNISPSTSVDESSSLQLISLQPIDSELPFPQNSGFSPAQPKLSGSGPLRSSTSSTDARKDTHLKSFMLPLPPHLHREVVRRRIMEGTGLRDKSDQLIRNFVSVVTALERWWWQTHDEKRPMEMLTPTELDTYLSEFYMVVTKQSGKDYDPQSFRAFPTTLDRFLKERNYPMSIQKSAEFRRSQVAYRIRLKQLKESAQLRKRATDSHA